MPLRYILIANPTTKRCETYRNELLTYWASRGATVDLVIVPWAEVIPRDGILDALPAFDLPAIVRLESPGKDDHVTRLLLEAGTRDDPAEPQRDWHSLEIPKGLVVRPGLVYRGFRRVLLGLKKSFDARGHLKPTACPLAIAEMFDKTNTAWELRRVGVPVPDMLDRPIAIAAKLYEAIAQGNWRTAYVKLNTGSSATGIVVLHKANANQTEYGLTTLAELNGDYYNSRLVQRVTGLALQNAMQFIVNEGAIVQQGIAMAQMDGLNFDVRVVCVYGKPASVIFRLSPQPMTNLHLGGRRGDFARCRALIPTREWLDALDHSAEAAACFDSAICGVDLVFERGYRQHYVLEANAFGDFFPGWTDDRGRSVHHLEIVATAARHA